MTSKTASLTDRVAAIEVRVTAIERRLPAAPTAWRGKPLNIAEIRAAIAAKRANIDAIVKSLMKEKRNG